MASVAYNALCSSIDARLDAECADRALASGDVKSAKYWMTKYAKPALRRALKGADEAAEDVQTHILVTRDIVAAAETRIKNATRLVTA